MSEMGHRRTFPGEFELCDIEWFAGAFKIRIEENYAVFSRNSSYNGSVLSTSEVACEYHAQRTRIQNVSR